MDAIEHDGIRIVGLRGPGGIGKTVLAQKLAELLMPSYRHAQFYLDLKGLNSQPVPVSEALSHVIRAYHPTATLPDNEAELRGLYQSVLHGKHAILLMDNAAGAVQVEPLIPPATCVLLVTSRQHFTLPGLFAKELDSLAADDARSRLLTITRGSAMNERWPILWIVRDLQKLCSLFVFRIGRRDWNIEIS
jgi:hypothetical protein